MCDRSTVRRSTIRLKRELRSGSILIFYKVITQDSHSQRSVDIRARNPGEPMMPRS